MAGLQPYDSRRREQVEARGKLGKRLAVVGGAAFILCFAIPLLALIVGVVGTAIVVAFEVIQNVRWGQPTITMPAGGLTMGETATAEFRLQGKTFDEQPSLTPKLICREEATYSDGSSRSTAKQVIHEKPCLSTPRHVDDGIAFDIEIVIPDRGPQSMDLGSNEIVWELEVQVAAGSGPDLHETYPFTVRPVLHGTEAP